MASTVVMEEYSDEQQVSAGMVSRAKRHEGCRYGPQRRGDWGCIGMDFRVGRHGGVCTWLAPEGHIESANLKFLASS